MVLIFRSVKSIVIAPASTGRDSNNKMAVIVTAHTKSERRLESIPEGRILITVEMKLMAPKIDEIPAI